jgi:PAS domain S-box-containing protein
MWRAPRIGLESGVKFFVPLLVVFLLLADTGLYYAFTRLQDLVVDEFDKRLLTGVRLVRNQLDPGALVELVKTPENTQNVKAVRQVLRNATGEGGFLSAMIIGPNLELLADSKGMESPGTVILDGGILDLTPVWAGDELFLSLRGEDNLWTRYVFVPVKEGQKVFCVLAVGSDFSLQTRLSGIKRYMLMRMVLLVSLVGAVLLFVVSVLRPFRRLKRTAEVVARESGDEEDSEFIITTFQTVIEELRRKETELQRLLSVQRDRAESLEEYNEYILSSMSGGLVSADPKGIVTAFNRAAGDMLGKVPGEVLNRQYEVALGHPALAQMIDDALRRGLTRIGAEVAVHGESGESYLSVSSSVIRGETGKVVGAALLLTDVTELKKLQEAVLIREKLASLGEMSAGIAHQFRNSLGSVIGYASLLKRRGEGGSTVDKILKESMILNDVVESFLSFAKPVKVLPSKLDLRSVVDEGLEPLSEEMARKGIEKTISFEEGDYCIVGDPVLLKQALTNVFMNSMDAMPDGGSLRVESERNGDTVTVKITDTGGGIPKEKLSHVFTPFFSLTEGGVGLGLPIAHRIITSHGGRIDIESESGVGTTVTVRLPLKEEGNEQSSDRR